MPDLDRFDSRRSTVYAPRGIVATSQPMAASAGRELLAAGGNAFDAAVATAAALNVVEPTSTGLGGDAFAMFRTANDSVGAMRACGGAPERATRDRVRKAIGDEPSIPNRGPHTVTVPGSARGWEATVERFGNLDLAEALQPAIRLATHGYPVTEVVSNQWQHAEDLFQEKHAREAYLFDGKAPETGQSVTLPALGRTLERIANEGADIVYEGDVARSIAEEIQDAGGFLTVEDLANFEVEWPDPLSTTYKGAEVFELGPNNQGQITLEALNIAAEIGAGDHSYNSPERFHAFVEAMKVAFRDGHHYITDPEFEPVQNLHDSAYAAERSTLIGDDPLQNIPLGFPGASEDGDTVLLTVADDAGNLVSFINSRYKGFGSGLVAGDTGIALQNRGRSFSLSSEDPNRLEPGKKPFHTLMPGIVNLDQDVWAAFGVMGGYMQPQGHVQVLANMLDYGMSLQAALDAPRWRYRADGTVALEERVVDGIPSKLARMGHEIRIEPSRSFGGAQIALDDKGTYSGATEPRKDGHVAPY